MKLRLIFSIFMLFGANLLCFQIISACSCLQSKPPCGGVDKSKVVFTGKVVKVSIDTGERNRQKNPFVGKKVQFKITETLNNVTAREIIIETGLGGGDCGFDFEEGEEYLVYSSENKGRFFTGICSRTALLSEAQDDLKILREIKSKKVVPSRLFGRTVISDFENDSISPLPNVKIIASNKAGKSYETVTDNFGNYRFLALPIGKYSVKAIHKENFIKNAEIVIDSVKDEKCAEQSFFFEVGGRITGRIIDAEGKPVAKLKVHAERLVFSSDDEKGIGLYWGYTDENGNYEIEGLQKGKYIVGINYKEPIEKDTPFPPTFYPNGNKIEQAETLIVTTDKSLNNLNFQLPPRVKPRLITGVVLFPDGKPAKGAMVEVKDERTTWRMDMADVDNEGKFTLSVFEGQSYYFYAYSDSADWGRNKEAQKILIPKTGEIELLKITVPFSTTLIINNRTPKKQ